VKESIADVDRQCLMCSWPHRGLGGMTSKFAPCYSHIAHIKV
jgi:hypothetical protein